MNFRDEIPQRAYINAQIIQLAEKQEAFARCTQEVCESYGIKSYRVTNPAHAAGLLYCLVVVPRELWRSQNLLERVKALEPQKLFKIIVSPLSKDPIDGFIRHLRNAVAHADFSVTKDGVFTFRDRRNRDNPPKFEAEISSENLAIFLSSVGAEMANARNYS